MSNPSLKEQLKALSIGLSSTSTEQARNDTQENHKNRDNKDRRDNRDQRTQSHRHSKNPAHSTNPNKQNKEKASIKKPLWLEQAQYGVELLKAYFPECFKELKEVKPLKIGIKQDLVKFLSTQEGIVIADKACMVNSLAYYVNSAAYHKTMKEGENRIDLQGVVTGKVTAEEARYSDECQKEKVRKKQQPQAQKNTQVPQQEVENK